MKWIKLGRKVKADCDYARTAQPEEVKIWKYSLLERKHLDGQKITFTEVVQFVVQKLQEQTEMELQESSENQMGDVTVEGCQNLNVQTDVKDEISNR